MNIAQRTILVAVLVAGGCNPKVQVEGGDKPIKIDMTITLKVDRELDEFFDFQHKYDGRAGTLPAAAPQE